MFVLRKLQRSLLGSRKPRRGSPRVKSVEELCACAGLRAIDDPRPDDVFVVGYPKSGNTWMQYLVASAFYGIDLRLASDALVQDLVPDVHFKKVFKPWYPVTFFKSHYFPRQEYRKVVYLVRDGRDAMVSYLHYLEGVSGRPLDFLKLVQDEKPPFPGNWHEHVEQWLSNPYNARMIVVRYEDLQQDPVAQLRRIADLAGFGHDEEMLEKGARAATFEAMKRREAIFPWENPETPRDRPFVRRGKVGSHEDEMPAEARDAFMREARSAMKRAGYLS